MEMKPSNGLKVQAWGRTLKQVAVIWLLSNLPLMCVAIWQWWVNYATPQSESFFGFLGKNLQGGEAFLYVASFVAPFFWTVSTYNEASKRVPALIVPLLLAITALAGSAFLFAAYRVLPEQGILQMPYAGIVLYLAGMFVWVKSMHDDHALPSLEDPNVAGRARVRDIRDALGE